jgi:hypothetical protein
VVGPWQAMGGEDGYTSVRKEGGKGAHHKRGNQQKKKKKSALAEGKTGTRSTAVREAERHGEMARAAARMATWRVR